MFDEDNNPVGKSKKAAAKGITQVVISRVTMAAPGMSELLNPLAFLIVAWRNVHVHVCVSTVVNTVTFDAVLETNF